MKHKTIVLLLVSAALFVLTAQSAQAQSPRQITPLHHFFQANYDSTIIYHNWSSWYTAPHYLIFAKHREKLYFFTYISPYRKMQGRVLPGGLKELYSDEESKFQRTMPDTNRYLLPQYIGDKELQKYWKNLGTTELWKIRSDKLQEPATCVVDDGDENTFYFITKKEIKTENFYAPSLYEECAGKDRNRQKAIQASELLISILSAGRL